MQRQLQCSIAGELPAVMGKQGFDLWTEERMKLCYRCICRHPVPKHRTGAGSRMKVEFRYSRFEAGYESGEVGLLHVTTLQQAIHTIREAESHRRSLRNVGPSQQGKGERMEELCPQVLPINPERIPEVFPRDADPADAVFPGELKHQRKDGGVEVDMEMSIEMIQSETGSQEFIELRS